MLPPSYVLENALRRVERIYPRRGAPKRHSRMKKQNRRKAEKRKNRRYSENKEAIKRKILKIDIEVIRDNKDYVIDNDDLTVSAIANMKAFEMRYLSSILDNIRATTHSVHTIKRFLSPQCRKTFESIQKNQCDHEDSSSDTDE